MIAYRKFMNMAVQTNNAADITLEMFWYIWHEIIGAITKLQLSVLPALYCASCVRIVMVHLQEVFVRVATFSFDRRYQASTGIVFYVAYSYVTPTNRIKGL